MKNHLLLSFLSASVLLAQEPNSAELDIQTQVTQLTSQIETLNQELQALNAKLPQTNNSFVTHTEVGYSKTTGNSDTETFSLDSKAKKSWESNSLAISLDAQYAKDQNTTTKDRYTTELNYGYDFTPRFTLGYLIGYKQDRFSGYDYQAYTGPEIKYKVLTSDIQTLSAEAGALYSQDKIENANTQHYASYRLKGVYELQIIKDLKFYQDATYRGSFKESDIYFVTTKTAVTSKINSTLSAGMSYKIDYANVVPLGNVRTDKTLTFNAIIDY